MNNISHALAQPYRCLVCSRLICFQVEAVGWNEGSEAETRGDRQAGKERAAPAGSVRLVATRAIGKNESLEMAPVCIVRDDHVNTIGNQELLCNYGFVDGGSRQERASIEFSVSFSSDFLVCGLPYESHTRSYHPQWPCQFAVEHICKISPVYLTTSAAATTTQ